jgi:glycosyltransferase involved in cell wall biosynthesis
LSLAVIILTYNEELHIERCIRSVKNIADKIIIVDSYSTDHTIQIATKLGADIHLNSWPGNQSDQLNWALTNISIDSDWILRLDADEFLLPDLNLEIEKKIQNIDDNITGIYLRRRIYFMGKWIKYGGSYPIKLLRLWRTNFGYWEKKEMDEHFILLKGESIVLDHDFVDENLNNFSWWINKHNSYSIREVNEYYRLKEEIKTKQKINIEKYDINKNKLFLKIKFYYNLPLIIRPFFYFLYRYIFLLGFLDGFQGFIWHFMQCLWYRILVDVKIIEARKLR